MCCQIPYGDHGIFFGKRYFSVVFTIFLPANPLKHSKQLILAEYCVGIGSEAKNDSGETRLMVAITW